MTLKRHYGHTHYMTNAATKITALPSESGTGYDVTIRLTGVTYTGVRVAVRALNLNMVEVLGYQGAPSIDVVHTVYVADDWTAEKVGEGLAAALLAIAAPEA